MQVRPPKTSGFASTDLQLSVQVVTTVEGLAALRTEWNQLDSASGQENPFARWEWTWHWWHVYGRSSSFRHYCLHIYVLRGPEADVRAIVPFVLTTWGWSLLATRALRLFGFRANTVELPGPIIAPGWENAVASALTAALTGASQKYDWCVLAGIPADGALGDWFDGYIASGQAEWGRAIPDYVLDLPDTWEKLRAGLTKSMRDNLSYYPKLLVREGHTWSFEVVENKERMPEALEELFTLHAARSAMTGAPLHPDQFRFPDSREFLRRLAADLAPENRLRICRLRVDGQVAASQLVLMTENSIYLSYSGFDPAWRRYSVMTVVAAECIKWAIVEGRAVANLSTWASQNKLRWGPEERIYRSVKWYSPTRRSRMAMRLHRHAVSAAKRWLHPDHDGPGPE